MCLLMDRITMYYLGSDDIQTNPSNRTLAFHPGLSSLGGQVQSLAMALGD